MHRQPLVLPRLPEPNARRPSQPTGFGRLLQDHRSKVGYSQEYLAEKAHVSSETIGALERGTRKAPYADTLKLLIDALELIGEERVAFETAAVMARTRPTHRKAGTRNRANLVPAQLTTLVGRENDIAKISALIAQRRLVTVTGFSGVGKTRVAQEVATQYARNVGDDVWFVDFAALDGNASVPVKVACVIGESRMSAASAADLGAAIGTRRMLLVFDNCEHVIAKTSATALTLTRTCPGVKILVASSERLGVLGETLFRLPSLSLPNHVPASVEEAHCYSAVALFIERAEAHSNVVIRADKLQQTVEICRRLDGVPRAIELAAARLAALGIENLLLRLNDRLVLTGGGCDLPERIQSPRKAIGCGYAGLAVFEQKLFCRLAIFIAGFTLEDAEAVCPTEALQRARVAELLDSLVHKSLVVATRSGSTISYRMLELARSYGLEKLAESGELVRLFEHHTRSLEALSRKTQPDPGRR